VVASFPELVNSPVGDCNDFAVAMAALGIAGRYPARFALGFDKIGEPVHIWAQLWNGREWLDVDPTPGAPPPGEGSPVDVPGARVVGWEPVPL
jgi:transglutaminase-like putative cysteine protease